MYAIKKHTWHVTMLYSTAAAGHTTAQISIKHLNLKIVESIFNIFHLIKSKEDTITYESQWRTKH